MVTSEGSGARQPLLKASLLNLAGHGWLVDGSEYYYFEFSSFAVGELFESQPSAANLVTNQGNFICDRVLRPSRQLSCGAIWPSRSHSRFDPSGELVRMWGLR